MKYGFYLTITFLFLLSCVVAKVHKYQLDESFAKNDEKYLKFVLKEFGSDYKEFNAPLFLAFNQISSSCTGKFYLYTKNETDFSKLFIKNITISDDNDSVFYSNDLNHSYSLLKDKAYIIELFNGLVFDYKRITIIVNTTFYDKVDKKVDKSFKYRFKKRSRIRPVIPN